MGFDEFVGIPHVGQLPHVYIRNHRVVGLTHEDPLRIELDPRTVDRPSYRHRYPFPPPHRFHGGEAARYRHEDLMVRLTDEAVSWLERQSGKTPFFLSFAARNVHTPLRPHAEFRGRRKIGTYGDFICEPIRLSPPT